MRTIPPDPHEQASTIDKPAKQELIFRFIIPFRLFGSAYFLGLLVGRDQSDEKRMDTRGIGGRIAAMAIVAILLFIMISGVFFILYLIKSLLGFNLFSNAHLME